MIAERDHLFKFVGSIHVQQWKWDGAGVECLLRQANHYRRILTDGVEHYRPLKFGGNFTNNLDALGFQCLQVADFPSHEPSIPRIRTIVYLEGCISNL